jgi:pilus assembly protein CpaC
VEKELVILVTPYLVHPMEPDQVGPLPGEDVREPDDVEFFLKGRIESGVSRPYRATSGWDDPLKVEKRRQLEQRYVIGPYGYSQ